MKYLLILFLVAGCTNYSETRTTELHAQDGSTVYVIVEDVAVKTDRETGQEATADTDAALSQMGATAANAAGAAKLSMENLKNLLDQRYEKTDSDNPVTTTETVDSHKPVTTTTTSDSNNPETTTTTSDSNDNNSTKTVPVPVPIVKPEKPEKPVKPEVVEYKNTETYSTRLIANNDKPFTWLAQTGSFYGGKIKFVFGSCGELIVPDATDNYSPNGHGQATYFCGTKNKPEEANGTKASVFGPPGCSEKTVTLLYNKGEE